MRATLTDAATVKAAGYTVQRVMGLGNVPATGAAAGWELLDTDGANLMIGSHGCIAPTQWEAVAEGLDRIEQNRI